jgi:copper(I)-binding protein
MRFPAAVLKIGGAKAQEAAAVTLGPIRIEQAWARATPGGSTIGGAYLRVTNTGSTPDRLVSGQAAIAERFELHEMSMTDGVMKMRPLADGITLAPGQTVEMRPGGLHVMLVGLKQPLKAGESFSSVLNLEKAGTVNVNFVVQPIGAGAPAAMGGGMPEMDHSQHMQHMGAPATK